MSSRILMSFVGAQVTATFLKRPQRFLAEMKLPSGEIIFAYCSNPGSLRGCMENGSEAILWNSFNPKRKLQYTWRAIRVGSSFVGTDTHIVNDIVELLLRNNMVPGLVNASNILREVKIGKMRADFVLNVNNRSCIVEVKSATVAENGIARFPDSVTPRGFNQLLELTSQALAGVRVVLIFVAQRDDVIGFSVTKTFDPLYFAAYQTAVNSGVETVALSVSVNHEGIGYPRLLQIL